MFVLNQFVYDGYVVQVKTKECIFRMLPYMQKTSFESFYVGSSSRKFNQISINVKKLLSTRPLFVSHVSHSMCHRSQHMNLYKVQQWHIKVLWRYTTCVIKAKLHYHHRHHHHHHQPPATEHRYTIVSVECCQLDLSRHPFY